MTTLSLFSHQFIYTGLLLVDIGFPMMAKVTILPRYLDDRNIIKK